MSQEPCPALRSSHPRSEQERRVVAYMLVVTAVQPRDPVPLIVLMESDNPSQQISI